MINIIHQIAFTGERIDGYVPPNRDNLKEFLPDAKHELWDLPRFTKLLKNDGAEDVLEAINNIKPYAFKADIARYYLIHKTGGWYVDQNNYFTVSPKKPNLYLNDKELIVFGESSRTSLSSWGVQNSLFYANPGHAVMEAAVLKCVENVRNKYYGFASNCPTGPNLFGSAIAAQHLGERHKQVFGKFAYFTEVPPRGFYLPNHRSPLALYKPYAKLEFPTGHSEVPGGNNYYYMWEDKTVY